MKFRDEELGVEIRTYKIYSKENPKVVAKVDFLATGASITETLDNFDNIVNVGVISGDERFSQPKTQFEIKRELLSLYQKSRINNDYEYMHEVNGWISENSYAEKEIIAPDGVKDSRYIGDDLSFVRRGSLENWVAGNNKYIAPRVENAVSMICSFAGLINQHYRILPERIIVHIYGPTNTGKTTLAALCLTPFTTSDELSSYQGTLLSRLNEACNNPTVPATIDDFRQTSGMNSKVEEFNKFIFALCNQDTRGNAYKKSLKNEIFSTIYLTSTVSIIEMSSVDYGQKSRIIEIKVGNNTIANSYEEICDAVEVLEGNCGNVGIRLAEKIIEKDIETGYTYGDVIRSNVNKFVSANKSRLHSPRLLKVFGFIIEIGRILNEFIGTSYNLVEIEEYLIKLGNKQITADVTALDPAVSYRNLIDYFCKYKEFFHEENFESEEEANKYIGFYSKKVNMVELNIPDSNDMKILQMILYNVPPQDILDTRDGRYSQDIPIMMSIDHIIKAWKNQNYILYAENRNKRKVRMVKGHSKQTQVFSIILKMEDVTI